ncbi:MAG: threonine synthase [Chloroflexota bacterium]|nr:threonine synthase [Chloroflexota bacterium]
MESYLDHLECTYCGSIFSAGEIQRLCQDCGKVLYARYDLEKISNILSREDLVGRDSNMWRYRELLPVLEQENIVSLGEGWTPIFPARRLAKELKLEKLFIKDEGLNPTASFKARGLSAAVSKAKELGAKRLTMPSAGNAAGAMSAYAARAGLESHIFMPQDAPEANKKEAVITGANVTLVDGLISDAGVISRREAAERNLFDISTLQEPYRVEGKKTMGFEIAEQMGWKLPDAIIYPTGGGTGIVGMWKAFEEMEKIGWIDSKRPKMFCVQSDGCAPIVRAFENGSEFAEPWENAQTIAAGMRVPGAIGDYLILEAIRESGGNVETVDDSEIRHWMNIVGKLEGLFVCPEGAATVAALTKLVKRDLLTPNENILLLNTGSGLKNLELL